MTEDGSNHQRWWEGYLVRYFLGFIVGCICVIVLAGTANPAIKQSITRSIFPTSNVLIPPLASADGTSPATLQVEKQADPVSSPLIIVITILGIGYCYISSTPITVLHSTRMMDSWFRRHSRSFWIAWALCLACLLVHQFANLTPAWTGRLTSTIVIVQLLLMLEKYLDTTPPPLPSPARITGLALVVNIGYFLCTIMVLLCLLGSFTIIDVRLFGFSLPAVWILSGQYWTLIMLLRDENKKFFKFYRKISKARQKIGSRDIRESYTHLREHANAIFVVLIELCILAGSLCINDVAKHHSIANSIDFVPFYSITILLLIGIWLVPTVFMWGLANRLEEEFSERPADFLQ